jgi:hypothetical protein
MLRSAEPPTFSALFIATSSANVACANHALFWVRSTPARRKRNPVSYPVVMPPNVMLRTSICSSTSACETLPVPFDA